MRRDIMKSVRRGTKMRKSCGGRQRDEACHQHGKRARTTLPADCLLWLWSAQVSHLTFQNFFVICILFCSSVMTVAEYC